MASRCITQLVLPPHAYSTVTAFSRACLVRVRARARARVRVGEG
tara:strand:- start:15 stop:146 length:132 start_codon:yes stop_codon:yes gene_type:complete